MFEYVTEKHCIRFDVRRTILWCCAGIEFFSGNEQAGFCFAVLASLGAIARAIDDLPR